ncbi:chromate transporter [Clostridium sardiniense]|uniref:Chromate transporter n=1 Tax=Clostridium sardiniense TaxID=29369 RepID=A0ABS7KVU4_CLOSR|nr:chromate transporter [Clostridium sardiniense]MBY0754697.1 chromate transporter [Clostridium sardiniense]MDQ0460583.1 chromate transporter [Clostridium sardiniense]
MSILIQLFFTFLKIGTFSFGGGYAMIPFIQREIIENHQWINNNVFMDIIGISQMTPGPVAINSATFVGYKVSGVFGSIAATLGVVTMSFILVSIASKAMEKFKESKVLRGALLGMRPVLIALIIQAFFDLAKDAYIDIKSVIITLIIGALLLSKKVHPIIAIIISGILGSIFYGVF